MRRIISSPIKSGGRQEDSSSISACDASCFRNITGGRSREFAWHDGGNSRLRGERHVLHRGNCGLQQFHGNTATATVTVNLDKTVRLRPAPCYAASDPVYTVITTASGGSHPASRTLAVITTLIHKAPDFQEPCGFVAILNPQTQRGKAAPTQPLPFVSNWMLSAEFSFTLPLSRQENLSSLR